MDAIILAAGLGTRLRPYTLTTPKPMLPIQGKPLLEWIIAALPASVNRLVVVTHYLADQVAHFVKTQARIPDAVTVHQEKPRGTGDALMACRDAVRSDRFFVLNGDDLYSAADLAALADKPAGVLVHPVHEPWRFGIAFTKADGTLDKLVEKPKLEGRYMANIGGYLFPRSAFDVKLELSPRGEYEITDVVNSLATQGPFHVVPAKAWLPIGDEAAWRAAEQWDLKSLIEK